MLFISPFRDLQGMRCFHVTMNNTTYPLKHHPAANTYPLPNKKDHSVCAASGSFEQC